MQRDVLDLAPQHLELVGEAVDDRVQQAHQHRGRIARQVGLPADMVDERAHRLGSRVAHRHQPVVGQHEADRGRGRSAVLHAREDADRHVERALALVETARRLDLRHLGLGRHVDLDAALDELLLVVRRLLEVDPGRAGRDLLDPGFEEASVAAGSVGAQHRA